MRNAILAFMVLWTTLVLFLACGCAMPAPAQVQMQPPPMVKPLCAVNLSAPVSVAGYVSYTDRTITDCSESDWDGIMQVRINAGLIIGLDIDRNQASAGNTYMVESGAVAVWTLGSYTGACRSGAVTWVSDEPDWYIDVDVFCLTEDGTAEYFLKGNTSGHVFNGNN